MKKKTLAFRLIDADVFENFFMLDSPGWYIAKEADAAGEIGTPLHALEVVCLLNKLYMMNLRNRILLELAPFGTDQIERYLQLGERESSDFFLELVGKDRVKTVLQEVMAETRRDTKIGENAKKTARTRRRRSR